jgi:hypothetical protein
MLKKSSLASIISMNWLLPEDGGPKLGSSMGALTLSNDDALRARTQKGTKTGGGRANEEDRVVRLMVFMVDKLTDVLL